MLLRLAALCGLLPSVFATFANLIRFGPNFSRGGSKVPCIWHDGNVSSGEGEVSISIGPRSSFLVSTNGVETARACKTESTIVIEEPGTRIFIVTEKDRNDRGIKEHLQILHWLQLHSNESTFTTEQSSSAFDFAVLETSNSFDPKSAVDPGASINLTFSKVESRLGLNSSPAGEGSQARGLRSASFNQNPNANYIYDTNFPRNGIKVDSLPIYDSMPERSHAEVTSRSNVKEKSIDYSKRSFNLGDQLESPYFAEPLIFVSSNHLYGAHVISSLTGRIYTFHYFSSFGPVSEAKRIPEDTKMKIVVKSSRSLDSTLVYKAITDGSTVWYLKKPEKMFYRCTFSVLSVVSPQTALKCDDLGQIWNVEWDDIFPLVAAGMIIGKGTFQPHHGRQIETLTRSYIAERNRDPIAVKEILSTHTSFELLSKDLHEDASVFRPGMQLHNARFTEPLVYLCPYGRKMAHVASSLTGKVLRMRCADLCPVVDTEKIPKDTKMKIAKSSKIIYKLITEGSEVWYLRKPAKSFYRCRVAHFGIAYRKAVLQCGVQGNFWSVDWEDIFPLEAADLISGMGRFDQLQ